MNGSTIYNLIEDAYLDDWKERFKNGEGCNLFKAIKQNELKMSESLTDIEIEELKRYGRSWENFYESMLYFLAIEVVHIGIKFGMEIENMNYED